MAAVRPCAPSGKLSFTDRIKEGLQHAGTNGQRHDDVGTTASPGSPQSFWGSDDDSDDDDNDDGVADARQQPQPLPASTPVEPQPSATTTTTTSASRTSTAGSDIWKRQHPAAFHQAAGQGLAGGGGNGGSRPTAPPPAGLPLQRVHQPAPVPAPRGQCHPGPTVPSGIPPPHNLTPPAMLVAPPAPTLPALPTQPALPALPTQRPTMHVVTPGEPQDGDSVFSLEDWAPSAVKREGGGAMHDTTHNVPTVHHPVATPAMAPPKPRLQDALDRVPGAVSALNGPTASRAWTMQAPPATAQRVTAAAARVQRAQSDAAAAIQAVQRQDVVTGRLLASAAQGLDAVGRGAVAAVNSAASHIATTMTQAAHGTAFVKEEEANRVQAAQAAAAQALAASRQHMAAQAPHNRQRTAALVSAWLQAVASLDQTLTQACLALQHVVSPTGAIGAQEPSQTAVTLRALQTLLAQEAVVLRSDSLDAQDAMAAQRLLNRVVHTAAQAVKAIGIVQEPGGDDETQPTQTQTSIAPPPPPSTSVLQAAEAAMEAVMAAPPPHDSVDSLLQHAAAQRAAAEAVEAAKTSLAAARKAHAAEVAKHLQETRVRAGRQLHGLAAALAAFQTACDGVTAKSNRMQAVLDAEARDALDAAARAEVVAQWATKDAVARTDAQVAAVHKRAVAQVCAALSNLDAGLSLLETRERSGTQAALAAVAAAAQFRAGVAAAEGAAPVLAHALGSASASVRALQAAHWDYVWAKVAGLHDCIR